MLPHYEQNTMKKFLNVRNLRARKKAQSLQFYQKVSFYVQHFIFEFSRQNQAQFGPKK